MSLHINNTSNFVPPDDTEIEALLRSFLPQPSSRFYSRMEKAPWMKTNSVKRARLLNTNTPVRSWLLGMAVFLIFLVLIGISLFPSVRAVARQIIYSFISSPSNQIEIQVTLANPGDLFHFSDPANFPLTIQEVQEHASFAVKEIKRLPEDLKLVGARFDPDYNTVTILYQGDGYKLFLTQRPSDNGEDVFSIGATAQVNQVQIGNYQGEFVAGGWKAISTQTISKTITPGIEESINAVWDSNLPQYTLRWHAEGFMYELRTIGEGSPSQSELIALANELK
jgi:hypothetical protein